jgi:anti-sigma-K factor RskA
LSEQAGELTPSTRVWQAIEARLDASGSGEVQAFIGKPGSKGLSGWGLAGALGATAAAAAALALWIGIPPAPETPPDGAVPQLIAKADGLDGLQFTSRIDPVTHRLTLQVSGWSRALSEEQAPELWVVPPGDTPKSLGLIPVNGEFSRVLTDREQQFFGDGAALAITVEERATAPHDAPTPPILVAAPLSKL